uniref:hAT-like transposase RNase-H fold domain-containing protein n=1 Tax=Gossypium raimondii TaxID=29730 RepID=A0A0D2RAT9_GOSRA|nr:hypothetical protein B456_002G224400 [Gossypium raimondii]
MKTTSPHYVRISRATTKTDCWTSYEVEKKRLNRLLKTVDRISITTDMWKLDCSIEGKVCSIFVENASYNDAVVTILKDSLSFHKRLPLNGKLFHVRCCAHILSLLVHDGHSKIEDVIDNVRECVKHIKASTVHLTMFSDIVKQLQLPNKRLILDCCTWWNATYVMLSCVLEFKDVFPRYAQRDASYNYLLTANVGTSMENDVQESGVSNASTTSRIGKGKVMVGRSEFERYIRSVDTIDNVKSELDIYLEEGVFICKENCGDFNALEW